MQRITPPTIFAFLAGQEQTNLLVLSTSATQESDQQPRTRTTAVWPSTPLQIKQDFSESFSCTGKKENTQANNTAHRPVNKQAHTQASEQKWIHALESTQSGLFIQGPRYADEAVERTNVVCPHDNASVSTKGLINVFWRGACVHEDYIQDTQTQLCRTDRQDQLRFATQNWTRQHTTTRNGSVVCNIYQQRQTQRINRQSTHQRRIDGGSLARLPETVHTQASCSTKQPCVLFSRNTHVVPRSGTPTGRTVPSRQYGLQRA